MIGKLYKINRYTRELIRSNPNTFFVFGDNLTREGFGGQAYAARSEPNTIGIPTKLSPADFFKLKLSITTIRVVMDDVDKIERMLYAGYDVVIPTDGVGTGLADLPNRNPDLYYMIEKKLSDIVVDLFFSEPFHKHHQNEYIQPFVENENFEFSKEQILSRHYNTK
jgi:hypothetical protein